MDKYNKIAVLIQCHKNPDQINRLIHAMSHPAIEFYIHVDAKAQQIRNEITKNASIHILPKEKSVNVRWAQFSQVQATLNILSQCGKGYNHYLLISGQDFPLKPIDEIVNFIIEHPCSDFIEVRRIATFCKRNDIFFPNAFIGRALWQKIAKNVWIYLTGGWNKTFKCFKRKSPVKGGYFFGSQWWCISGQTMDWIQNYLLDSKEYQEFFSHSLCPDECFFQTLCMSSPFNMNILDNFHYIKFEDGMSSPKVLKDDDYELLISSGKMIARKFDSDIDDNIIKRLERITKKEVMRVEK